MSYDLEVEMIREARKLDLLTCPYVFDARQRAGDGQGRRRRAGRAPRPDDEGLDRREDGADARRVGARACRRCTTRPARCARTSSCICHGGPIAEPEDVEYVLAQTTGIAGFFGASSIERFATESGIEEQARRFRDMTMPGAPKPQAKAKPTAAPRRGRRGAKR